MWQFINQTLFEKRAELKDLNKNQGNARADVRIIFREKIMVKARTDETSRLPEIDFSGYMMDFSTGGTSMTVSDEDYIPTGVSGSIDLDFLDPPQTVKIEIL
ncbi:MAG: hypothetical protein H6618_06880 [Deltaproteobacteria bacterium]|nr:hypothetical protein [Deltaproteobacteria bacterium]